MPWALFCSKWFVCLYCEVLPVETVLRIWDTLFYEGSKILFRVALGLLKLTQDRLLSKADFASLAEDHGGRERRLQTRGVDRRGRTWTKPRATRTRTEKR